MTPHVPTAIRLVDVVADGSEARHYTFAPVHPVSRQQGQPCPPAMPGQFFMLNIPGAGESAFTFSALPDADGCFGALVRQVGSVTTALFALEPGAILGARGPFGHGWPLAPGNGSPVLVVGGGCGLAPLVSAVRELQAQGRRLVVLYSARTAAAQLLHRERASWRAAGIPVLDVLDTPAAIGPVPHLDLAIGQLGGDLPGLVLTCGPEAMMFALARDCERRGIPADRIFLSLERRMHCGTGHCGHCYIGSDYCCTDGPVMSWARARPRLAHGHGS